jgi:hypothetical protein
MSVPGKNIVDAYDRLSPAKFQTLADGASLFKITRGGAEKVADNPKDLKPEDRLKAQDAHATRVKSVIDSYLGANGLAKLEAENQPKYLAITKRASEIMQAEPGASSSDVATRAISDVERQMKLGGGQAPGAAPAAAGGVAPFTPWK